MGIEEKFNEIIRAKRGNKELALFYLPDEVTDKWSCALGNTCSSVMLGEVDGQINVSGENLESIIVKLWKEL